MNARIPRQQGFTLVEAIIVMVITGVLAGVVVLFIRQPVRNYTDAAARAELSDAADLALRRMTRELRGAVPNSVRWMLNGGVWYLEFIPAKAGGLYLAAEDNVSGNPLSFTDSTVRKFDIVGTVPRAPYAIVPNTDFIVVYNLGPGFQNADAYEGNNRALVTGLSVANNITTVTLANNPFAAAGTQNASPDHRFQVAGTPVTFACDGRAAGNGTLRRFANYGYPAANAPQQVVPNVAGMLMANNVLACDFSVTNAGNQRAAMIGLSIALARVNPGAAGNGLETVTLAQQIHVNNTP